MKAVLEFVLPEEFDAHRDAVNGCALSAVIIALDKQCREWLKWGHSMESPDKVIQAVRDLLREELADRDLDWVLR